MLATFALTAAAQADGVFDFSPEQKGRVRADKDAAAIVGVTTSESGMMRMAKAGKEESSLVRVPKARANQGTPGRKTAKPSPKQTATPKADTRATTPTKAKATPKRR